MANTADISRGMIIKLDGSLYTVVEFGENKTARAAAKVWAKLKGVDNSRSIEKTWNSGDTIHPVRVEKRSYQFLYKDDTGYNFMDQETFEQVALQENLVDAPQFRVAAGCDHHSSRTPGGHQRSRECHPFPIPDACFLRHRFRGLVAGNGLAGKRRLFRPQVLHVHQAKIRGNFVPGFE